MYVFKIKLKGVRIKQEEKIYLNTQYKLKDKHYTYAYMYINAIYYYPFSEVMGAYIFISFANTNTYANVQIK